MTFVPSGEKQINSLWPGRGGISKALGFASHNRTFPRADPDTRRVPSGENTTHDIGRSCPRRGERVSEPETAPHTRIVVSDEHRAMSLPSRENTNDGRQK